MFLRFNLYTFAWVIIILMLVLLPGQQMPDLKGDYLISVDKVAHAFIFCILVLLMIIGFTKQSRYPALRNHAVAYSLKISVVFAISLEMLQFFSSARMVEFLDAVANVAGCISGWLLFLAIYKL